MSEEFEMVVPTDEEQLLLQRVSSVLEGQEMEDVLTVLVNMLRLALSMRYPEQERYEQAIGLLAEKMKETRIEAIDGVRMQ